jgi:hypothetical protein
MAEADSVFSPMSNITNMTKATDAPLGITSLRKLTSFSTPHGVVVGGGRSLD